MVQLDLNLGDADQLRPELFHHRSYLFRQRRDFGRMVTTRRPRRAFGAGRAGTPPWTPAFLVLPTTLRGRADSSC